MLTKFRTVVFKETQDTLVEIKCNELNLFDAKFGICTFFSFLDTHTFLSGLFLSSVSIVIRIALHIDSHSILTPGQPVSGLF